MTSTASDTARTTAPDDPGRRRRRRLRARRALLAGVVAGPLLAAVSFAQIPFRDGFDMTRHAFSFLLLGPGATLQVVNYLLVGGLFVVSGHGLRDALGGRFGRVAQVLATLQGAGLIVAGLFPPPPSFGYPAGAPAGLPAKSTTDGVLHGLGFVVGVTASTGLLIALAAWFRRRDDRRWAAVAFVTALAMPVVPATATQPYGTVLLYVFVTAGWVVTSALYARIRRLVVRGRC